MASNPKNNLSEKLELSKDFLEFVLNTIQGVVYVYDFNEKKNIFINENIFEATGFKAKEIMESKSDLYKASIHPDDLSHFEEHRQALKNQEGISQIEYRLRNNNGKWMTILSRDLVFKRDANGEAIQYLAATTDISEIKLANDLLTKTNKELLYKNEELASFASIASHDLKEPLRKITMFSKLIKEREEKTISESSNYNLDRIIVSIERMQQLIDDLLEYSEINVSEIVYVKTDLNLLIEKVKLDLKDLIEEKQAIIEISNLPNLEIIPSQFSQVFTNLIHNAIKYSKDSDLPRIKITAEQIPGSVLKHFGADDKLMYCKIAVEDNGIGFPNESAERIFEPFKRLHPKDIYSGTGIGLAICKKIVLNHKGFIAAESEIGKGSRFYIYIPCQEK